MSPEEREYLKGYSIAEFPRPSIAADVAVFSVLSDGEREDIRHLEKKELKVLLIRRANYPYRNCWSMPGGFCIPNEDVLDTACRELREETNVSDAYLKLVGVYGEAGRDPRGWIISNTFMALIDGSSVSLRAGTDAWEARFFRVALAREQHGDEVDYRLTLTDGDVTVSALAREQRRTSGHRTEAHYHLLESNGLAFDHGCILIDALLRLRSDVENDLRPVFDLMPDCFTLTELQTAYELVSDKKALTANFRRKVAPYVRETGVMTGGDGYRPAMLYERGQ